MQQTYETFKTALNKTIDGFVKAYTNNAHTFNNPPPYLEPYISNLTQCMAKHNKGYDLWKAMDLETNKLPGFFNLLSPARKLTPQLKLILSQYSLEALKTADDLTYEEHILHQKGYIEDLTKNIRVLEKKIKTVSSLVGTNKLELLAQINDLKGALTALKESSEIQTGENASLKESNTKLRIALDLNEKERNLHIAAYNEMKTRYEELQANYKVLETRQEALEIRNKEFDDRNKKLNLLLKEAPFKTTEDTQEFKESLNSRFEKIEEERKRDAQIMLSLIDEIKSMKSGENHNPPSLKNNGNKGKDKIEEDDDHQNDTESAVLISALAIDEVAQDLNSFVLNETLDASNSIENTQWYDADRMTTSIYDYFNDFPHLQILPVINIHPVDHEKLRMAIEQYQNEKFSKENIQKLTGLMMLPICFQSSPAEGCSNQLNLNWAILLVNYEDALSAAYIDLFNIGIPYSVTQALKDACGIEADTLFFRGPEQAVINVSDNNSIQLIRNAKDVFLQMQIHSIEQKNTTTITTSSAPLITQTSASPIQPPRKRTRHPTEYLRSYFYSRPAGNDKKDETHQEPIWKQVKSAGLNQ